MLSLIRKLFRPSGNIFDRTDIMVMVLYLNFPVRRTATSIMLVGALGIVVALLLTRLSELIYDTNLCKAGPMFLMTLRAQALISVVIDRRGECVRAGPIGREGPPIVRVMTALTLRPKVCIVVLTILPSGRPAMVRICRSILFVRTTWCDAALLNLL